MAESTSLLRHVPEQRTLLTTRELLVWIRTLETGRAKDRKRVAVEMRRAMEAAHDAGLVQ